MKIRCIIIEDEIPAQNILIKYIRDLPALELIGVFTNGMEAMSVLREQNPDLIFLDINLPKLSGIHFLRSIQNPPKVIFTTAYSNYAVEGFELNAIDYLVKPFSFNRFLQAIDKVLLANNESSLSLGDTNSDDFIFIKSDKKIIRIDLNQIRYIESLKDYVKIVSYEKTYLILHSLKKLLEVLDQERFVQCHKSFIINIKAIEQIGGNMIDCGQIEIPIGRSFKPKLMKAISGKIVNN